MVPVAKVRGRRKGLMALVNAFERNADKPCVERVYIAHAACPDDAEFVAARLREQFDVGDILIHYIDPVIGAHTGPGALGLLFTGSPR